MERPAGRAEGSALTPRYDAAVRSPRVIMKIAACLAPGLFTAALAATTLAAERPATAGASRALGTKQQAPKAAVCPSPDGPQPEGTIRCEMCPAAPGARIQYRPMACTSGKWVEAGPCADGDCAGRTY
jgi:hypothetical protein